jgi:hypothetical protein
MRLRRTVCVVLSVWVLAAESRAWAQGTNASGIPEAACRPECEAARLAWIAAEADRERAFQEDNEANLEVYFRKVRILTVEEDLKNETGAEARASLTFELDHLRVGLKEAEREAKETGSKYGSALSAALRARSAYRECCEAKQDKSGLPAWTYIAAGVGGAVAIGSTIGSDSPATGGSPNPAPAPTAGSPTTSNPPAPPAPQPAPPPEPTPPPPAAPRPTSGNVANNDPGGSRIYAVQFTDANVDQTLTVNLALLNTDCRPSFFNDRFTSQISISGTGPFSPPAGAITGSGSGTFLIGGQQIRGQLTITITGNTFEFNEHLVNMTLNCFGDFYGRMVVFGF